MPGSAATELNRQIECSSEIVEGRHAEIFQAEEAVRKLMMEQDCYRIPVWGSHPVFQKGNGYGLGRRLTGIDLH